MDACKPKRKDLKERFPEEVEKEKKATTNLYLISQDVNEDWDTYDSAVVAAQSVEEARKIHPENSHCNPRRVSGFLEKSWCDPSHVKVTLIGERTKYPAGTVVIASFNAG